ncbi:MAG: hypothetical protein PHE84_02780 [bacterium]|nr:hypothetical protein [bacterium]
MIKRIRQLTQALVVCFIIGALGCSTGATPSVTISIPLDPQQTTITGLKGQVRISGMSGTFPMTISGSNASASIPEVPGGSRTFTITFFIGPASDPVIVAEITLTKNVSADINLQITYAATDFDYDFDDDADGYTNYEEIIAGSDPEDYSSYPTGGGSGTPSAPTGLTATQVAGPAVNLTWTDNSTDEDGFKLEWSADGVSWYSLTSLGANVAQYTDSSGVVAGSTYYYRVYAYNTYGNSGYSNSASITITSGGGSAWTAGFLGAGGYHSCAVTSDGGVKCWGCNDAGRLGNGSSSGPQTCNDGTNTLACSTTPVDVSGLTGVSKVVSGGYHSCALTTAGGVKCWGSNVYGQLGNGSRTASSVPVNVTGLTSGVANISAGSHHTCALMTAGGVKCWGENTYAKLGNGSASGPQTCNDGTNDIACSQTPVNVVGLSGTATAVSAGLDHTCVLISGGSIQCWGQNNWGELGNGSTTDSTYPVNVTGITSGATLVSASADGYFTCAVISGGVKCWGANDENQLGVFNSLGPEYCNGSDPCSKTPAAVSSLTSGVTSVSTGALHACALLTAGGMKCWGYNNDGELGNNSTTGSYTPVSPNGLSAGISQISVGFYFSCIRLSTGSLKCWGNNYYGQAGDGTSGTTAQKLIPVDVKMTQ